MGDLHPDLEKKFGHEIYLYLFPYWSTPLYQNSLQQVTLNLIFFTSAILNDWTSKGNFGSAKHVGDQPALPSPIAIMQICLLGRKAEYFPHCSILLPPAPDKILWHTCLCLSFWELTPFPFSSPLHNSLHSSFCWMSEHIEEAAFSYLFLMLFGINILRGTDSAESIPERLGGGAIHALNLICQIDLWRWRQVAKDKQPSVLCSAIPWPLRARRKLNLLWRCWLFQALHKQQR